MGLRHCIILLLMLTGIVSISAQRQVRGVVTDAVSGEPLPLVNVYVKGTTIGVTAGFDGVFVFDVPEGTDSVSFNTMGYRNLSVAVDDLLYGENRIQMNSSDYSLDEVVVKLDDLPQRLVRSVIANKPRNNPTRHRRVQYEKYDRMEYAMTNISDWVMRRPLVRGAQHLMYIGEDSSRYLPVYSSETISLVELQRQPNRMKATIIADDVKGIDVFKQYEIGGMSQALTIDYSFYENVVEVFNVPFVSPIADNALRFYDYFVIDSAEVDGGYKSYTVKFRPHVKGNKVFEGTMDIETRYYTITRVDCSMPKTANVNFVKQLDLSQTYQLVDDSLNYFATGSTSIALDYVPINSDRKRLQINCCFYQSERNVKIGMSDTLELSNPKIEYETVKQPGYDSRDTAYWNESRHYTFNEQQRRNNESLDKLNEVRSVRVLNRAGKMAFSGFFDVGKFEIGPYTEVFNTNAVEGVHVGFGVKTSKEISERWMVMGILGYGFRNSHPTYEAQAGYKFKSLARRVLTIGYSNRLVNVGESESILNLYENMLTTSQNNLIAQFFKREDIDELMYEDKFIVKYAHEWRSGYQTTFAFRNVKQSSPPFYSFRNAADSTWVSSVSSSEISADFRWSFNEKYIDEGMYRMYLSGNTPIVHLTIACGNARTPDVESYYVRLRATLKHRLVLGPTELNYAVEAGAIFGGALPYTLLEMPRGNKTYGYYKYNFNMMGYMEFAADKFAMLYADYDLGGLLFNRIKPLRKAGLREVVGARLFLGGLDSRHSGVICMPQHIRQTGRFVPYSEVSIGIDNILRFFRVDCVWRLTQRSAMKHCAGIRASVAIRL